MYYLRIDVHKRDSQIAVLDYDGEIVAEHRLENDQPDELAEVYEGTRAVIEATTNYYTLDEYLDVVVADPHRTKAIGLLEAKSDSETAGIRPRAR